jgi:oligopeptide/dipeptide ABC transporter ATP-binding protein
VEDVYSAPMHPYTRFLLNAVQKPDPHSRNDKAELLAGEIPSAVEPPSGCRFHTRCPYATEKCKAEEPPLREIGGRKVACHFPLQAQEPAGRK